MTSTPASPPPPIAEPYSIERGSTNPMSCDAEPVQTPGCIQSRGVLLVLRRAVLPPRREEVAR